MVDFIFKDKDQGIEVKTRSQTDLTILAQALRDKNAPQLDIPAPTVAPQQQPVIDQPVAAQTDIAPPAVAPLPEIDELDNLTKDLLRRFSEFRQRNAANVPAIREKTRALQDFLKNTKRIFKGSLKEAELNKLKLELEFVLAGPMREMDAFREESLYLQGLAKFKKKPEERIMKDAAGFQRVVPSPGTLQPGSRVFPEAKKPFETLERIEAKAAAKRRGAPPKPSLTRKERQERAEDAGQFREIGKQKAIKIGQKESSEIDKLWQAGKITGQEREDAKEFGKAKGHQDGVTAANPETGEKLVVKKGYWIRSR